MLAGSLPIFLAARFRRCCQKYPGSSSSLLKGARQLLPEVLRGRAACGPSQASSKKIIHKALKPSILAQDKSSGHIPSSFAPSERKRFIVAGPLVDCLLESYPGRLAGVLKSRRRELSLFLFAGADAAVACLVETREHWCGSLLQNESRR